jgi:hypothetical protein
MHRKKIRRWHKLLSASGIIVAVFGMLYVPAANAQLGGPIPDGIYGPSFSKDDAQILYLDFPNNIVGLQTSDLYITGSATGCVIDQIPAIVGFSFGVWVRGCSDGYYNVNLKAESVAYQNGKTGPTVDYVGAQTIVDRTPLQLGFQNVPMQVTSTSLEWQITSNHLMVYLPSYDFSLTGGGCNLISTTPMTYGLSVMVDGCQPGVNASLTLNPNSIQDRFGNQGPAVAITSSPVKINIAVPTPTPTPTSSPAPTSTPSPTATPTPSVSPSMTPIASPTAIPTPTPSVSASPSDPPVSVAVAAPPIDPPAPPTAPEPQVIAPVVSQPDPAQTVVEPAVGLTPIAMVRNHIVQVRKAIAVPLPVPVTPVDAQPAVIEPPAPIVQPAIETQVKPEFNWQPLGYLAIAAGSAAAVVGGGLLIQRMMRVRRLKFS